MPKLAKTDFNADASPDARQLPRMARIWDPIVRLFHWGLVLSFAVAWFTPETLESLHYWAGYVAGGLVVMRLLWGVLGTPYARFSQFVKSPKTVLQYLRAMLSGKEARHLGHNPAGGAMVLALMGTMLAAAVSGWMMTTNRYFGIEWVANMHELIVYILLGLVAIHLAGVIFASLRHKENLILSMFTGRKRVDADSEG